MDLRETKLLISPELKTNCISRLFYLWIVSFLRKGAKKDLNFSDVYQALPEDSSEKLGNSLEEKWNQEVHKASLRGHSPKLWKVVVRIICFRFSLVSLGYAFDEVVLRTVQPLMLRNFIRTFNLKHEDNPNLLRDQYVYASVLVLVTFIHAIFTQKLIGANIHIGMKTRLGVSSLIYRKILRLRKSDPDQTNVGRLCNLLSSDVGRFDQSFHFLHVFYVAPIQLAIYTYLLWEELGISCLGGIGFCLVSLPLQVLLGRFTMYFRLRIGRRTDERGRFLNEVISGIRLIKMYAWEKPFSTVIAKLRKSEIKYIRGSLYLKGTAVSVRIITMKLIPFCAFILYIALGNTLTADKVFFSISVFNNIIQAIMNRIPTAASQLGELIATLQRVETFMLSKEITTKDSISYYFMENMTENIKPDLVSEDSHCSDEYMIHKELDESSHEPGIYMKDFSASWADDKQTLRDLNVNLSGNKLVLVVGHVGSGKSSFLNAILSELPITSGDDRMSCNKVHGQISYASQEAWIFPATVRQNILFGLDMDEERYWETIRLCCLSDDLKQLPHGDLSLIGERGVSLSGGQKARVNLARAIYQKADIYLLDDPLSAVDTKVSKSLFNNCIKEYLTGKLRILVTHQLQYLPMADHIIVLNRNGEIWGQGTYDELKNSDIDFTSLISDKYMNEEYPDVDELQNKPFSTESGMESILQNRHRSREDAGVAHRDREEQKKVGSVGFGVYFRYFRSGGSYLAIIFLFFVFIFTQVLFHFTDYWLSLWTNAVAGGNKDNGIRASVTVSNNNIADLTFNSSNFHVNDELAIELNKDVYTYVYCGIMAAFVLATILRSILYLSYCMRISINLHDKMFKSIVRAPVKFFDDNPSGRIMNRFTKDMNQIDEQLPVAFSDFINIFLSLLGTLVISTLANYYIAIPSVILLVALWKLRVFFLETARDLKRIEALAKSPMFTHVTMTVQGLITIRALKAEKRVLDQFEKIQDIHSAVYYMTFITGRWFALWLEILSVMFLAVVSYGFLLLTTSSQSGNVGVAISSILALGGALQWGIRQSAETESYMTSVERVFEYSNLKPEAPLQTNEDKRIQPNWPEEGRITFENVSLAYDEANEIKILNEVTFFIRAKEKVGIVGRTGAGKSSLITALFRLTEPCNGIITIDDVPVDQVGLHMLRSRISIIPQDPVLFSGTLRYNLDPFDEFEDDQLMNVLKEVDLQHAVQHLDHPVADGGSNFSTGQKQLLCLARALLRKNKILVLDEATANVDPATDQLVQQTIRTKFVDCTILTIAHRLQTVLDNDKIMVLDAGKVLEFDSPEVLMRREGGALFVLLNHWTPMISE